ncbi:MAG TPA: glycine cleavage system aminomethyltransferase GcvT [Firmicutes bacterium]|nr:glycine cleavage system aminomethyltransferase GcvT [Bacillota bacterium]
MQTTPLFPIYLKYQAKVIDFHGWDLPVQFGGIIQEHLTVRNRVGLFDVSHMGEIMLKGPQAAEFLDYALTNQIATLRPGYIRYSPLCYDSAGIVDDLLVYCLDPTQFLLVVNASNTTKDLDWLENVSRSFEVTLENLSDQTAQLAIQGPHALRVLQQLTDAPLAGLKYYQFLPQVVLDGKFPVIISRTGYTGEDGFELYLKPDQAVSLWELIMHTGTAAGIQPIGLGARDTLRFEAGLPLYGNELSQDISPLEAGLDRFVKFSKSVFVGREALLKQQTNGIPRTLIGLEMIERGIPRSGCSVIKNNQPIGFVTSGSYAPTLAKNLAIALIQSEFNSPDSKLQIDIRGKLLTAKIIKLPFYSRPKGVLQ